MKVQFRRIPNSENPQVAEWAQKFFDGATEEERKYFDVGVVHELNPLENGKFVDWATVEQVVASIINYNEQWSPEGFNDNPSYVAYSLLKCVEAGLAEVQVTA